MKLQLINPATGRVEHPHPLFSTWGEAVEKFVNTTAPEIGSYVAYDLNGLAVCGRVSNTPSAPRGDILIQLVAKPG